MKWKPNWPNCDGSSRKVLDQRADENSIFHKGCLRVAPDSSLAIWDQLKAPQDKTAIRMLKALAEEEAT